MGSVIKELATFAKAQTSALLATGCDYLMRVFLDKVVGFSYVSATFFGAVTGGIVNCIINYQWAFRGNDSRKRDVFWRYLIVWVGSVLLNTGGTAFFKEVVGLQAYTAMMLTSVLVALLWNYTMQRVFVFKGKKR